MRDAEESGWSAGSRILAALLFCASFPTLARTVSEGAGGDLPVPHMVGRATSEIVVDGILDEPAWRHALTLELSYEVRPGENIEPPVRTELLITYDDRSMFFAFRAFDPDPSRIRARFSDRDGAWDDDWVGVVLDTFNDQRRAYELICNPLGVQMDALNDDVLENYDDSWNAIWESGGRITEQGYQVEMAIPFNQIRFQDTNGKPQTWGFDAMRSYPRSDRHHIGLFPRDRGNNSYLSQTVKLVGMEGVSPGRNLEIAPTVTSSRTDSRDALPAGDRERGPVNSDVGVSVRWGITPNVSLNGAVNPDFSQVEADVLQLDINEQFALFYPETRPFFLEGADYFNTPLRLVHTRAIADPSAAVKITGKQGKHTYGLFSAQDNITNLIFPGPEGSSSGSFDLETTATVGRYRYDFGKNSTVGATLTDRRGGGYSNRVASVDASLRFTDADRITSSLTFSRTRYSEAMIADAGLREDEFGDRAVQIEYLHTVRNWWIDASWSSLGDGFRSDLGFRPQVGLDEYFAGGARIWWGEEGDFYRRMAWGGAAGRMDREDGGLLEKHVETWFNMNGPRESYGEINLNLQDRTYNGERFSDRLFIHSWFEIQASRDVNLTFHTDRGDWIDFENTRPATFTRFQPGARFHLGRHILLQYSHTLSWLDVDGGRLFRVSAPEIRVVHQFNTRSFLRAILQYTDIERNVALYDGEIDSRSRDLFSQFLFTYKVNPQTALYVGYSDEYSGTDEYSLTQSSRTFFAKLGYAWVM